MLICAVLSFANLLPKLIVRSYPVVLDQAHMGLLKAMLWWNQGSDGELLGICVQLHL